jgi:excinuclease ABC subunit C
LGITDQPLASIAKREEWIYVYGQEDEPVVLDKFSPVLHLVQTVRDEAHRFAVTFHRTRRNASRLRSELDQIAGVGEKTVTKLLRHFGSVEQVRQAPEEELVRVAGPALARKVREAFGQNVLEPQIPDPLQSQGPDLLQSQIPDLLQSQIKDA